MDLFSALGINAQNLALRRQFLGLGAAEKSLLEAQIPWIERRGQEISKAVYDHQFGFAGTRAFLEAIAAQKKMPTEALRSTLERTMRDELVELFRGARNDWGVEYFRRLVQVGDVHNRINLPQKWYIGMYPRMMELIIEKFRADHPKGDLALRVQTALFKVMNLGIQAVADGFFFSAIREVGIEVGAICTRSPDQDVTECQGEVKAMMARIYEACAMIAAGRLEDPQLNRPVPGKLGAAIATTIENARTLRNGIVDNSESLSAVSAAVDEMKQAVSEISRSTSSALTGMQAAESLAQSATKRMASLNQRSQEIGNVVKLITSIADQTNLLALNATIEAARSGEAGRGFAVVANEVKELARQAAEATDQIRQRIQAMQSETTEAVTAIDQIGTAIGSIAEASQSIASAVEEQNAVNDKLAHDMQEAVARTRTLIAKD